MRGYRPRSLGWLATVFVVATTLMIPWPALAQDATPAAGGEPTRSLTREEFTTQLRRGAGVHRGGDAWRHVYRLQYRRYPDRASVPGGRRGYDGVVGLVYER